MLSEVEVRRCRKPKKCTCRLPYLDDTQELLDVIPQEFQGNLLSGGQL